MQREEEKPVTEDREQTSGADREQTSSDVEAHSTIGQAGSGQTISQTDDDESDVEAHTMIGQTSSQTSPQTNP
jgi:hypothetical protein